MKPTELQITATLQSRITAVVMSLAAFFMLVSGSGMLPAAGVNSGSIALAAVPAAPTSTMAVVIAGIGLAISAGIISLTNQTFNIVHTQTRLDIGLFLMLACAVPGALGLQATGILLCITTLLCLMIMYTTYQRRGATRRIFLVFTLLSAGSTLDYAFAAFIPAFILGCWQMRCLTFRSFLAILIGLVTPYWILWGLGIISLDELRPPSVALSSIHTFRLFSTAQIVAIAVIVVAAMMSMLYNLIQVLGRNARTRAFNGILAGLTFWTCLATVIDFGHALTYMPLLCALTGLQLTIYFITDAMRRAYIAVLLAVALSLAVFAWNLTV